jgi:hypothetical protein
MVLPLIFIFRLYPLMQDFEWKSARLAGLEGKFSKKFHLDYPFTQEYF